MLDGTEVIRSYRPVSGELARGIHLPDAAKLAIGVALQSVGTAVPTRGA